MIGRALTLLVILAIWAPACRRGTEPAAAPAPARETLLPVSLPDLSTVDASVQAQAKELFAALEKARADSGVSDADLGQAYGQLAIVLHASEYYEAARPAYLNAQALLPRDRRWPYYLGHLARNDGDTAKSIESFRRALELNPGDVATLIWLGRGYAEMGQPERAEEMFQRALSASPGTVAALAGLGQAALARKDYPRAVRVLEEALEANPGSASLHSPLAMAYRGLGDTAKADEHLKQWRNTDIVLPDPLRQELDMALQSGLSYELRGVRALETRDFTMAVEMFRRGLDLAPPGSTLSRSIRHKLGTALALQGDVAEAVRHFQDVVRTAPDGQRDEPAAKAHYSLGVLAASAGDANAATRHLSDALRFNPNYLEARLALGDVLRRQGRFADSLVHYQEALTLNPRIGEARFGYAMALVRLGRYRDARDWLAEAVRVQPDHPEFAHALARILAAAPDASARDGQRAMAIVQQIYAANASPDVIETMAMVAAERGDFTQAVAMQRELIDAARQAGQVADANRLLENLRRYEQGQPSRVPWPPDHPVHRPGS